MKHIVSTIAASIASALLVTGCSTSRSMTAANSNPPVAHDPNEPHPDAPLTANTHFAAGQVAESQGDSQRAITQYQAACDLDPSASVPLLRMGMLYTQLGQFDQAVETWKRYIKVTNGDAAGYCDMGYTLELAQRFSEAESAYRTAIQRQPLNQTARVDYGLMLARQNRMAEATEQLQKVLTPGEVHYNLASVLESQGKKIDAKAEYRAALKLDPDMSDAQTRLSALDTN